MAESKPRPTVTHQTAESSTGGGDDALSTESDGLAFGPPAAEGELGRLAGYRVLKLLGKGGMGAVYLGFHESLHRKVALKVMLPKYAADPVAKERFLREARTAAAVRNDHVVTIYDTDESGGIPFIAMELLQGYPLDDFLRRKGRLSVPQALRVGLETAEGLAAAHALGLVHRDIKPANLWLEAPKGRIKILDFGLAKPADGDSRAGELTGTGVVVGTPAFMSPEQARGETVDHRTDLFSLGAVLYHLTTGRLPFEGPTVMAILTALATREPPPVSALNPEVPPALAAIIHRLMAKEPDARPQSAVEVAAALRALERGEADPNLAGSALASAVQPQVVYVPIQVTAYEQSAFDNTAFENLDSDPAAAPPPKPRARGGVPVWAVAGALLLAGGIAAGAFYLLKKPADTAEKPADPKPTPQPPVPKVADRADRRLAEWVFSTGGSVSVTTPGAPSAVAVPTADKLPPGEFTVVFVYIGGKYAVTDADLDRFAAYPGLVSLSLGATAITDAGLAKLLPLADRLVALEFDAPQVTDAGFGHIARLVNLTSLRAYRTAMTDEGLRLVAGLDKLTDLRVNEAKVTDAGVAHLARLKKLATIYLHKTGVGDAGVRALAKLPAPIVLALSGTAVTDEAARVLGGIPTLVGVYVSNTAVTDAGVAHLARLPKLAGLGLEATGATDAALDHLAAAKALTGLAVRKTAVTLPGVKRLTAALPDCKIDFDYDPKADPDRLLAEWAMAKGGNVSVTPPAPGKHHIFDPKDLPVGMLHVAHVGIPAGKYALTDADLDRFAPASGVTSLSLGSTALTDAGAEKLAGLPLAAGLQGLTLQAVKLSDAGFAHLARIKSLRVLRVAGSGATDTGLKHVAGLTELIDLSLASAKVTDAGLAPLAGLTKLVNLDLAATPITDEGLKAIGRLKTLNDLHLGGTGVTDAGLEHLGGLKGLRKLDVRKTAVSTPAAKRFMVGLPKCEVFYDYDPKADPDRVLAGWVASKGGGVSLDGKHEDSVKPENFPPGPVRVTAVWLWMTAYRTTDADLDLFRDCGVVWLALGNVAFTDEGLEKLAKFPVAPRVEMLAANSPAVTDAGLARLKAFSGLKVLELHNAGVTDDGLKTLAGFKTLKTLDLKGTKVTAEGVKAFKAALPECMVTSEFDKP